ncbi:unnamed protein product [Amoebophrya sp. A25]|nr:unnamed protein product [Amoebophrya sp. A25]|eukprot:GSA25T00019427001.1
MSSFSFSRFAFAFLALAAGVNAGCSAGEQAFCKLNGQWRTVLIKSINANNVMYLEWAHDPAMCMDVSTSTQAQNAFCTGCAAACYSHASECIEYQASGGAAIDYTRTCGAAPDGSSGGSSEDEEVDTTVIAIIAICASLFAAFCVYGIFLSRKSAQDEAAAGDPDDRRPPMSKRGMSFNWGKQSAAHAISKVSQGGAVGRLARGMSTKFGQTMRPSNRTAPEALPGAPPQARVTHHGTGQHPSVAHAQAIQQAQQHRASHLSAQKPGAPMISPRGAHKGPQASPRGAMQPSPRGAIQPSPRGGPR